MMLPTMMTIGELEDQGAIVAIQDGNHGNDHPKSADYTECGIAFVMATDIRDGKLNIERCKRLPQNVTDRLRIGFSKKDDVLLTHKGTVGEVAIVPDIRPYVMLTPQVTYYRTDQKLLLPRYLSYAFRSPHFQGQLSSESAQSTRPYIGIHAQRRLRIFMRKLAGQHRVASILSAYDDLIDNNMRRIAALEEMARRLYEEWFVHFRFPGHEEVRFKETGCGQVPGDWEVNSLGDLVSDIRDAVHPSQVSPDTPYVGLEHIPRRSITLKEWSTADTVDSNKLRFRRNDILFGKIRPYFHKVCVAPIDGICSTDTILMRPRDQQFFGLALCCTSSDQFVDHANQTSNGTKMPRADWRVLKAYPVPMPDETLLRTFNAFVVGVVEQTRNLMLKNANLRSQRDLLLPKLISGEIDVSQAEERAQEAAE